MTRPVQQRIERDFPSRGMTAKEAAAFFGVSSSTFYKAKRDGKIPGPTLPGRRYDRHLLEQVMDRHSGIDRQAPPMTPLDEWRSRRGAGQL